MSCHCGVDEELLTAEPSHEFLVSLNPRGFGAIGGGLCLSSLVYLEKSNLAGDFLIGELISGLIGEVTNSVFLGDLFKCDV